MNDNNIPPADPPPRRVALAAGWTSLKDFIEWTQEDPEGLQRWEQAASRLAAGAGQGQTPELLAAAAQFVAFRKQNIALRAAGPSRWRCCNSWSLRPAPGRRESG